MKGFKNVNDPKFNYFILKKKEDVFHALKYFFSKHANKQVS
jgi:uncharacterized sporulation protein YeaH/YhbH (DUF444 family)